VSQAIEPTIHVVDAVVISSQPLSLGLFEN
jgi:hypothetical protein